MQRYEARPKLLHWLGALSKITKNKNAEYLDTLSIAHAANKNFEAAAASAQRALQIWEQSNKPPPPPPLVLALHSTSANSRFGLLVYR